MRTIELLRVTATPALLSWLLVGAVLRYAIRHQILDNPGPRASHTQPTPRGGGLGLVATVLLVLLTLPGTRSSGPLLLGLGAVVLTAFIGWLDDHRSRGVHTRLLVHFAAGVMLLPIALSTGTPVWMGGFAGLWWVFWAISAINVINFMDGIDGLIGSQSLVYGAYLALLGRPGGMAAVFGMVLAGASVGFLVWNWQPARIFLGDVGSGALGLLFVLGGLLLIRESRASIVTAFLPLYPLFLDAFVTLVRRFRRGERITEAHRDHLYQRLANGGWGHARVSILYAVAALLALPVVLLGGGSRTIGVAAYFLVLLGSGLLLERPPGRPSP